MSHMRGMVMRGLAAVLATLLGLGVVAVSDEEAVAASRPKITKLSVTSGPTGGGTSVTVRGRNFTQASTVWFGQTQATAVRYVSTKKLVATAPPSAKGKVVVRVETGAGRSAALGKRTRFTFVAPPVIASLSARTGPVKGGTKITVKGSGFTKVTKVLFGGAKAKKLKVKSSTKLTAVTPAHGNGYVDVTVVGRYGASAAARFLYGVAPVSVVSGSGPLTVGSFNITVATGTAALDDGKPSWAERRSTVAAQILREGIDVIGLQEASASAREVPSGVPQFQDVADLLVEQGGAYALTNTANYCDGPAYSKCPNGAGQSDRIIYNTGRLRGGSASRSGEADPHRDRRGEHVRVAGGHGRRHGNHEILRHECCAPSVHQFRLRRPAGKHLPPQERVGPGGVRAELVNVRYSSLNNFKPAPQSVSGYEIGSYMDYILLSSRAIAALEWKTVVDLDAAGNFTGTVPSDHNLVKLTIALP